MFYVVFQDVNISGVIHSPISNVMRKVEKASQDVTNHRKVILVTYRFFLSSIFGYEPGFIFS